MGEIEKSPELIPVTLVPLNATVTGLVFATVTVALAGTPFTVVLEKLYEMGLGSPVPAPTTSEVVEYYPVPCTCRLGLGADGVVVDDDVGRPDARGRRVEGYAEGAALAYRDDKGEAGGDRVDAVAESDREIRGLAAGVADAVDVKGRRYQSFARLMY